MTREELIRVISMLENHASKASQTAQDIALDPSRRLSDAQYFCGQADALNTAIGHLNYYLRKA